MQQEVGVPAPAAAVVEAAADQGAGPPAVDDDDNAVQVARPPRPLSKRELIRELGLITGAKTLCVESVLKGMDQLAREELGRGCSFTLPGLVTLTPHLRLESPPRRKNVAGVMRDVPSKPRRFQVKAKASKAIAYLPAPVSSDASTSD